MYFWLVLFGFYCNITNDSGVEVYCSRSELPSTPARKQYHDIKKHEQYYDHYYDQATD